MKIRTGFVSNSSSSSFIVKASDLTGDQLNALLNIADPAFEADPWQIEIEDGFIKGTTWMDNFDMGAFFENIGVVEQNIIWGD